MGSPRVDSAPCGRLSHKHSCGKTAYGKGGRLMVAVSHASSRQLYYSFDLMLPQPIKTDTRFYSAPPEDEG